MLVDTTRSSFASAFLVSFNIRLLLPLSLPISPLAMNSLSSILPTGISSGVGALRSKLPAAPVPSSNHYPSVGAHSTSAATAQLVICPQTCASGPAVISRQHSQ